VADIVAKVPKGAAKNFPPKKDTGDNRRSKRLSNALPESPVSLGLGDMIPHIIIRSLHLQVGEFGRCLAKRILQQYRH
jgi:hypothetical protein